MVKLGQGGQGISQGVGELGPGEPDHNEGALVPGAVRGHHIGQHRAVHCTAPLLRTWLRAIYCTAMLLRNWLRAVRCTARLLRIQGFEGCLIGVGGLGGWDLGFGVER